MDHEYIGYLTFRKGASGPQPQDDYAFSYQFDGKCFVGHQPTTPPSPTRAVNFFLKKEKKEKKKEKKGKKNKINTACRVLLNIYDGDVLKGLDLTFF